MNGVGGDLFAIVYDAKTKTVRGLNASGARRAAATLDEFRRRKLDEIPYRGVLSVSVPGVVDGWQRAAVEARHDSARARRRARDRLRARRLRRQRDHRRTVEGGREDPGAGSRGGGDVPAWRPRAVDGRSLQEPESRGRRSRQIARGGRDAFYRGPIAQAIAADMKARGGLLTAADLAAHRSDWITPISTTYRGYEVLRAAAEHAGGRRARDAQHPRGLRRQGARPQLGGLSAPARGGQADRVCGSRGVAGRSRRGSTGASWRASSRRSTQPNAGARSIPRRRPRATAAHARRPAAGRAGTSGRQGRHDLPDGCRPRGQRRLADSIDLRELRLRHRRRRHGHHAPQPRQPVLAAAGTSQRARARQAPVPHARARDGA